MILLLSFSKELTALVLCLRVFSRGYMGAPPQHQAPPVHMAQMAAGPPPDMRGPPMDMRGPPMVEPRNMMGDPRGPMMMEPRGPPMETRGCSTIMLYSLQTTAYVIHS